MSKLLPVLPVICLLLFSISGLHSQQNYEQIALPKPWPDVAYQVGLLPSEGLSVTILAESSFSSYGTSTLSKVYYSRYPNLSGPASLRLLPITAYGGSDVDGGGSSERLEYSVSEGENAATIFYSKQEIDNLMLFAWPPAACVLRLAESSGRIDTLLLIDNAKNPFVFRDSLGRSNLVWASVAKVDSNEWLYDYLYKGAIYGQMINTDDSVLPSVLIDSGYFPHVKVDSTGRQHILYFSAPTSESNFYTLKYAVGFGGSYATVAVLRDSVPPGENTWDPFADFDFSVSNDGRRLHIGWSGGSYRIYSLEYAKAGVHIDTLKMTGYASLLQFLYSEDGRETFVFWNAKDSLGIYHRYYSDNINRTLFSETNQLPDVHDLWSGQFFLNPATNLPAYVYLIPDSGFHFVTDIESGEEAGFIKVPEAHSLTQFVIDHVNNIYALYQDVSGISHLIHFFSISTGVSRSRSFVPVSYSLQQNYPNPFNPATTIHYQLPNESSVNLSLYNILGQEIRTLVNTTEQPGEKTVQIDANGLPSGIYFYRLDATSASDPMKHYSQVRKMVLIK
jgi:hypothetical protein